MVKTQTIIPFALLAALLLQSATSRAECDPTKILRDNVTSYQESIVTWLSYVNSLSKGETTSSNPSLGVSYQGFDLSFSDAQAASNYYQISTKSRTTS